MTAALEILVTDREHRSRLDTALGADPRIGSRARAQALIDRGLVSVDGHRRPKRYLLSRGERIHAQLDDSVPVERGDQEASVGYEIIYEDSYLLVVDKPAGLVVHPAPGHRSATLSQALSNRAAGQAQPWRPGIVHRLDRDTSGLLVVAKNDSAHRAMQGLIRARALERRYSALIVGHPQAQTATIDAAIGRDRRHRTRMSLRSDRPREARTHFSVVESHEHTSLLAVSLETGRTHQIRAHLSAIGHPVCGDREYGGGVCGTRLGLSRQFLHAELIAFEHPFTGKRLELRCELPQDLDRALARARDG